MRPQLFLDIETIPCQDPAYREALALQPEFQVPETIGEIKPAGILKDPEKIAADIAAKTAKAEADLVERRAGVGAAIAKAWRKTSLDGTFGHVALVSWGYVGEPISTEACLIRDGEAYRLPATFEEAMAAEKVALTSFFAAIEDEAKSHGCAPVIVAHHAPFDLRFLIQRAVVHGIRLPHWWPRDPKPWSPGVLDTSAVWGGREGIKLDTLCRALGLKSKGDIDGAAFWDAWSGGRLEDCIAYNVDDVERLRGIVARLETSMGGSIAA